MSVRFWMLCVCLLPSLARAQDSAQEAYDAGVSALERNDSEAALEAFRASLAIESRPDTALALAATLQERGALSEAIAFYDRLLSAEYGSLDAAIAGAVQRARDAADMNRATLTVVGAEELGVEVDGTRVGIASSEIPLVVRLDPGEHLLRARVDGQLSAPLSVHLRTSERRELTLHAPQRAERVVESRPAILHPPGREVRRPRAGPWVLLGSSLAPLAIGIGTGVAFRRRVDEARDAGNLRDAEPIIQHAQRLGNAATATFALAGALAAAGFVWVIIDRRRTRADVRVGVSGVSMGGPF